MQRLQMTGLLWTSLMHVLTLFDHGLVV